MNHICARAGYLPELPGITAGDLLLNGLAPGAVGERESSHGPMMIWTVAIVGGLAFLWQVLYLAVVLQWSDLQTRGARYYARSQAWRRRYKGLLRIHAALLSPILALLGTVSRSRFSDRCIRYAGIAGPAGACSAESFKRAADYAPRSQDVFVVTQMRSGTTWMQHLVYQVVTRGMGDLTASGTALNAVSPWLESIRTIGVHEAPLVGIELPRRIVKTHLPVALCPFDQQAKYIYVARHPLACFASCVDFVRNNLQGFAPNWEECARWFMSDELMWWGNWVSHVGPWQRRAAREANVLLVRFEDLTDDLATQAQRLATFLGVEPLSGPELASVVNKCRLDYMRGHADEFEMHPPHLLQSANPFFRDGGKDRARAVPPEIARQILDWCRAACADRGIAIDCLYPDLAAPANFPSADSDRQHAAACV